MSFWPVFFVLFPLSVVSCWFAGRVQRRRLAAVDMTELSLKRQFEVSRGREVLASLDPLVGRHLVNFIVGFFAFVQFAVRRKSR